MSGASPLLNAILATEAAQDSVVNLYTVMRKLSSTQYSSERKQLKGMLGDLRIMQSVFKLNKSCENELPNR